jgi:hypothetical protein
LPTPEELEASAEENLRKSRVTALSEHIQGVALTGFGAAGGLVLFLGAAGAADRAGRRKL